MDKYVILFDIESWCISGYIFVFITNEKDAEKYIENSNNTIDYAPDDFDAIPPEFNSRKEAEDFIKSKRSLHLLTESDLDKFYNYTNI